ncbi:MAG: hypothetical protein IKN43_03645 [Selenomonadaceae bacterium]|nr:hypothetical protein [Selenomonadaceae bacterium]
MLEQLTVPYEGITPAVLAGVRNNRPVNIEGEGCVIIPDSWWRKILDNALDEVVDRCASERLNVADGKRDYTFDEVMEKLNLSDTDLEKLNDNYE